MDGNSEILSIHNDFSGLWFRAILGSNRKAKMFLQIPCHPFAGFLKDCRISIIENNKVFSFLAREGFKDMDIHEYAFRLRFYSRFCDLFPGAPPYSIAFPTCQAQK